MKQISSTEWKSVEQYMKYEGTYTTFSFKPGHCLISPTNTNIYEFKFLIVTLTFVITTIIGIPRFCAKTFSPRGSSTLSSSDVAGACGWRGFASRLNEV